MKPKAVKKTDVKPKKDKSQSKRLKTFSSSQFSQWEQKNKALQASATDLTILKQQTIANRRAQNNSALSQYSSAKSATIKLPLKKKKKTTTKTKPKVKKIEQQEFQRAKYKQSNSQSQIVFSNDQTKRQSCISVKDVRYIQTINGYEADSNLVLRINIKKQYVRKVQAATKIQKVFRGYMTRKILLKCISDEEQKLKSQLVANQELSSFRQGQTHRTFADKDGQNLLNRLFQNRAVVDINFNHTIRGRAGDFQQEQQNQKNSNKKGYKQKGASILKNQALANINKNKNLSQKQQQQDSQQQQSNQEQEQEDQDTNMLYKRQNPIYSQQQISQYLQSSSQQQQQQELDAYQPEIIFQTNQQYIQSRKSSLQNKNEPVNKLSNKSISDLVFINQAVLQDKIRKQLKQQIPNLKVVRKKQSQQQLKYQEKQIKNSQAQIIEKGAISEQKQEFKTQHKILATLDGNEKLKLQSNKQDDDIFQTLYANFNSQQKKTENMQAKNLLEGQPKISSSRSQRIKSEKSEKSNNQKNLTDKLLISPRRQIKYLDQQDINSNSSENNSSRLNRSRVSAEQKEILRLREQQCQKWDEVIRMVSQQIKKSNQSNQQMVNFMKNIMEFSQKNKQLLGSTRSVNSQSESFTTPTSMGVEIKEGAKSVGLPIQIFGDIPQIKQKQQEKDAKFLKKKKPLKIDILDSNSLKEQKQSIVSDKSENSFKNNIFQFQKQKKFVRSTRNKDYIEENRKNEFNNYCNQHHALVPLSKSSKTQIQQCLQNSKNLKKFLSSNIQVQDEAIYQILKLRQQLLQKRQSEELIKLNNQLSKNQLSQQKFLQKLSQLTRKFVQEKQIIDKAKNDILKGYQAATNLVKQYFFDVRRMGIKMTVSKSQDNLKYKFSQPGFFGDIKIDQLTPKSTPKSEKKKSIKGIFNQFEIYEQTSKQKALNIHHSNIQSSEDSSIDFTQEQLKRFRKAANYDLEFNYLNKNMTTISDQFIKQQRKPFNEQNSAENVQTTQFNESPQQVKINRNIQPQRQTYLLDQSRTPSTRTPPHIEAIIQNQINILIWQFASQLMLRPQISQKFIQKPSIIRPAQIKIEEKLQFLSILQDNLPQKTILHRKLNQNISPLPHQILKCMRLDFSDQAQQQEEDNYQEINRYQFVISQEACAKSVMLFKNNIEQVQQRKQFQEIQKSNQLVPQFQQTMKNTSILDKIQKFVQQRQKFLRNKKQHTRQLRWQVMNIQLHCIFDSWNEQIIQICSSRPGFSGIGLNQLTLSMKNHNRSVPVQKSQSLIFKAKQKVIQILTDQTDINVKILRENFHEMCENDSAWVFYADQALSYALELVYLVQQDIYSELTRQLRKIMIKNSLTI